MLFVSSIVSFAPTVGFAPSVVLFVLSVVLFVPSVVVFVPSVILFAPSVVLFVSSVALFEPSVVLFALSVVLFMPGVALSVPGVMLFVQSVAFFAPNVVLFALSVALFAPNVVLFALGSQENLPDQCIGAIYPGSQADSLIFQTSFMVSYHTQGLKKRAVPSRPVSWCHRSLPAPGTASAVPGVAVLHTPLVLACSGRPQRQSPESTDKQTA